MHISRAGCLTRADLPHGSRAWVSAFLGWLLRCSHRTLCWRSRPWLCRFGPWRGQARTGVGRRLAGVLALSTRGHAEQRGEGAAEEEMAAGSLGGRAGPLLGVC